MATTMWSRLALFKNFLRHSNNKIYSTFKVSRVSSSSQHLASWDALKFWCCIFWHFFCLKMHDFCVNAIPERLFWMCFYYGVALFLHFTKSGNINILVCCSSWFKCLLASLNPEDISLIWLSLYFSLSFCQIELVCIVSGDCLPVMNNTNILNHTWTW